MNQPSAAIERREVIVRGTVQGVGFRPFVYRLACRHGLGGRVQNHPDCVRIEVEGLPGALECFLEDLTAIPPPAARIEAVSWRRLTPLGEVEFRIAPSSITVLECGVPDSALLPGVPMSWSSPGPIVIPADRATCLECLAELFDPADRRYLYPFLNCTNCGPRLTIMEGAPYDRRRTSMSRFELCPQCREEYDDPGNRRFHAQPTACPACGPRWEFRWANSNVGLIRSDERASGPLAEFAAALQAGRIGALKGLGGFHLACDARNQTAVRELRRRKQRDEKPLAVMVADLAAAERLCLLGPEERRLLTSPRAPIVLARQREPSPLCQAVAPGNPYLGVLLPYTPLHHLLLRKLGDLPLVMTSGNRSDEPIAYENDEALRRLGGIADMFLLHDRPIRVRCDDSVTRVVDGTELPIRRSRGEAPLPIPLPCACTRPILAVGGQLKNTFALGSARQAVLSHHLGDLDHLEAYRSFERDVSLYQQLFRIQPELIVHDLHPDYASTNYARQRAACEGLRRLAVQHHHAHMAACMAEHGLNEPVIGVTFDGAGYGIDEVSRQPSLWGGEFLVGEYRRFRRAAHLRCVGMPGGARAVREPWRMAVAHLLDAGESAAVLQERVSPFALAAAARMLDRRINAPLTSSAGRLFDAVASICGVCDRASYEGQAAQQLEWLATDAPADEGYPFDLARRDAGAMAARGESAAPHASRGWEDGSPSAPWEIDTRPMMRGIVGDVRSGTPTAQIAARFHATMVRIIVEVCTEVRRECGLDAVVFSGGVFLNPLLTREAAARLRACRFRVYRHCRVPPNDGGLSLGQLAIAAAMDGEH